MLRTILPLTFLSILAAAPTYTAACPSNATAAGGLRTRANLGTRSVPNDIPLGPGMRAPALKVGAWLKGKPIESLDKGVAVVEFWATWCVPCRVSMEHLTNLAKRNPNVAFVGISVWENGKKTEEIQRFVDGMGAKMGYSVAADGKAFMEKNWMAAAKQGAIPTAFLLNDGVIQWIGNPSDLELPMAEVLADKFDLEQSKARFRSETAEFDRRARLRKNLEKIDRLIAERKGREALALADRTLAENPQNSGSLQQRQIAALALFDPSLAKQRIDEAIKAKDYWSAAGAAGLFTRRHEVAEYAAERLLGGEGGKDPMVSFLVGSYYVASRNRAMALKAIDMGYRALEELKMDEPDMRDNLARLRKSAEAIK